MSGGGTRVAAAKASREIAVDVDNDDGVVVLAAVPAAVGRDAVGGREGDASWNVS